MIVMPTDFSAWFDVDETLILWSPTEEQLEKEGIVIECPGGAVIVDQEVVNESSWKVKVVPHKIHIEQLIKHKLRNQQITVWSAGGYRWAETVVRALQLEQYVDLVISKPTWAYDDLDPQDYMPKSTWMEDK